MTREERLTAALQRAREVIEDVLDADLRSACLIDQETGEPLRDTMDEILRSGIEDLEQVLAQIDNALAPLLEYQR